MPQLTRVLPATVALVSLLPVPAVAQSPRASMVVTTEWLAQHLTDPDLVLLHMGDPAEYAKKHVAGARLITRAAISAPAAPGTLTLEMPTAAALEASLEGLGISDRSRIVLMFAGGWVSPATRVMLTLQGAGLGDRTSWVDGGLEQWEKDGRPVTADGPAITPGALSPLTMQPPVVDAEYVRAHLKDAKTVIIDARDPEFYRGERTGGSPTAPHKTGHIDGAHSVPYSAVVTADNGWKSESELRALFTAAGVKAGDTVVAYCHIGQQATAVVFAARMLGLDVRLYDGSFEDWSRRDGPVIK